MWVSGGGGSTVLCYCGWVDMWLWWYCLGLLWICGNGGEDPVRFIDDGGRKGEVATRALVTHTPHEYLQYMRISERFIN